MQVVIDRDQDLFVIPAGRSFSILGFEYVFKQLGQLVSRLNLSIQVREDEKGTITQLADYQRAVAEVARAKPKETWFHPDTPGELCQLMEKYRKNRRTIRFFYGDKRTGRDWLEESDVMGIVCRSSGIFKVPILCQHSEPWGVSILDHSIVKLMDVADRQVIWEHEKYQPPQMQIVVKPNDECPFAVFVDGGPHVAFSSYAKAAQWVAFMDGESMDVVK